MSELEPVSVREANVVDEEQEFEKSLRPTRLAEYIGQKKATENLRVFIRAALNRREALDHVLLTGPPGLGKTTLSNIIANEMGAELRSTAGPVIEKPGDLAALLTNLQEGDVAAARRGGSMLPPEPGGRRGLDDGDFARRLAQDRLGEDESLPIAVAALAGMDSTCAAEGAERQRDAGRQEGESFEPSTHTLRHNGKAVNREP